MEVRVDGVRLVIRDRPGVTPRTRPVIEASHAGSGKFK